VRWTADSPHTLAVEVQGEGQVCGVRGNTWLAYTRHPKRTLDLAGEWTVAKDFLSVGSAVRLPGGYSGKLLSRSVDVPSAWTGCPIYLRVQANHGLTGCLINGRYVRRHHHGLGDTTFLNIAPWLKTGARNTVELLGAGDRAEIARVELWMY